MEENSRPTSPVDSRIVYVRAIDIDEIPEAARMGVTATSLYAIHDENGARLAVVADRDLAFAVARQNELTPLSAH